MFLNTSQKIGIARFLSSSIISIRKLLSLPTQVIKRRQGITWSLNLREGIDFAIYLLGGFETNTLKAYTKIIKPGDIVLDIGANIGAHTLPLAHLVGSNGKIIAFEPTQYAFSKLTQNISLNSHLAERVNPHQMMLISEESTIPETIYSSWPLETSGDLHAEHKGRLMSIQGAAAQTLDKFISSSSIQKINFIKLDVDGNEFDVLLGGRETLEKFKPTLIMELAPYVYKSCPEKFNQMLEILWNLGYELKVLANNKILPKNLEKIRQLIPPQGGINALAVPRNI